jgi:predicted AAA+ superfamily ATPase
MTDIIAFSRQLVAPKRSFFLFGARGTGKSTWLRSVYPEAPIIDLLHSRTFLELSSDPGLLESKIGKHPAGHRVVIDEIQKIPSLLDEVHRLIEAKRWDFALSGSSARKLKRGGANLLAARAQVRHFFPLNRQELGESFDLQRALEWGSLPLVCVRPEEARETLLSYVHTYLKQEIMEEGLVKRIEPFSRFIQVAGMLNGQILNIETIAREAMVKRPTVDQWFEVLEETLVGFRLPGWRPQLKVRETSHPKFYWFDPGVARATSRLLDQNLDTEWLGRALETQLLHELRSALEYQRLDLPIAYYRTGAGVEIDFVITTQTKTLASPPSVILIEAKFARRWDRRWESGMRDLMDAGPRKVRVQAAYGVYLGKERLSFDGIEVWPVEDFLNALHSGKFFGLQIPV